MTIILPPGVRSVHRPVDKPLRCLLCGESFALPQQALYTDHVSKCVQEHSAEIQNARPSTKNAGGVFDPQSWDEEYEEWLANLGQRMLREGRLERKAHER